MKKTISLEQINKYNQMAEAAIGTGAYDMLGLYREYRDDDTKNGEGIPMVISIRSRHIIGMGMIPSDSI